MMRWLIIVMACFAALESIPAQEKPGVDTGTSKPTQPNSELKKTDTKKSLESEEARLIERISDNSEIAVKRLAANDPGDETRRLQRAVLKDIDALLERLKNPPQDSDQSNSSGGASSSSSSKGGSSSSQRESTPSEGSPTTGNSGSGLSRREQRERRRQQEAQVGRGGGNPMPGDSKTDRGGVKKPNQGDPMAKAATDQNPTGSAATDSSNQSTASANSAGNTGKSAGNTGKVRKNPDGAAASDQFYKDVWGHLPERARQEMDAYFKNRFMPRYSDLLRQYYSTIAEQGKK